MPQFIKHYEQALTPEFCRKVMALFDADERVQPDPQPDYSTRKYLNISECPEWLKINLDFSRVANDIVSDYFAREEALDQATHHDTSDDGYVVSRYDPGDAVIMHVDGQCAVYPHNGLRLATLLFYLNDVPEGGETFFPLQNVKIKPEQGKAVMFPVGFTHPHSVLPATSKRYIMQTWITDGQHMVVPLGDMEE